MNPGSAKKVGKPDLTPVLSSNQADAAVPPAAPTLTLALDVRRTLIVGATLAAVVAIAGITILFERGFVVHKINGAGKTQKDRDAILDKWNGYSGNFAAAIGRPLETVIAMTAQLLVLRFLTSAMLQPEPKWHVAKIAVVVSAVLGFLLNNGLNALNVQLRDADVTVVIKASDLRASTLLNAANGSAVSNVTQTYPETQPNNSITNTALRGVIMPRAMKQKPLCDPSLVGSTVQEDSVSYGFQQQDWMKHVLPEALDAKTLRVVLNATDANANKDVASADLPMNASRAADLFTIAAIVSRQYIPWGKVGEWTEYLKPEVFGDRKEGDLIPTAVAAGLLPYKSQVSEIEQRDFFLRATQSFFNLREMNMSNMSQGNIELEFAHVDVSHSISFDAMTLRVELDPAEMTQVRFANNNTRYGKASCGPFPGVCTIPKVKFDPEQVVHAFSACVGEDGSDTLQSLQRGGGYMRAFFIQCARRSNSSVILLSTSRKTIADATVANAYVSGESLTQDTRHSVVQNPRKFYSFTVSRLGWTAEDLATKYSGKCDAPGGCMGLDFETMHQKTLLAGLDSLPLDTLRPVRFDSGTNFEAQAPYRLVTVIEPPMTNGNSPPGDYVLAHNVGSSNLNRTRQSGRLCYSNDEERQQLVLDNHMYMESTLQTTYTAGVFFLFQNAALRDKVSVGGVQQTLAFDGNEPHLSLWISIPSWNALLTGAGCLLLIIGSLSALVWSSSRRTDAMDTMDAITTAHVVARVLLDENSFPPSVVRRRVVVDPTGSVLPGDTTAASLAEDYYIESLTLKPRNQNGELAANLA